MTKEIRGREEIDVRASLEDVYWFRLDCLNLPELNPAVRNVRRVDGGAEPPSTGTRYLCDVDLEWGECVATVEITEAVHPSLIVLDMQTVRRVDGADPGRGVRSREVAFFSARPGGVTHVEVELTLYPADDVPDEELAILEANAGAPINVELLAMKLALEKRPERMEEHNAQA
jgi:hypothetical protein